MQSIIVRSSAAPLRLETCTGQTVQVRNHVKNYAWRFNRTNRETYLDNTATPYTDKLNMNEFNHFKRQLKPWQRVIPKERDSRFNNYKWIDSYRSDPKEAQQTAESRLQTFAQSVKDRGSARESRPYNPPDQENVQSLIISMYKSGCSSNVEQNRLGKDDASILSLNLNEHRDIKFGLITKCIKEFDHHLPTSYLNDMNTVQDLVNYYSTPVRGLDPYSTLARKENELPTNLCMLTEIHRWNKETDQAFGGYNALPGLISEMPGLRGKKKYPTLNQEEFQWPDI